MQFILVNIEQKKRNKVGMVLDSVVSELVAEFLRAVGVLI